MSSVLEGPCEHPGCACMTGDRFCGAYCAEHGSHHDEGHEDHPCECGHAGCPAPSGLP